MRHVTYSCNLCGGAVTRDTGVGIEFKSAVKGRQRLEVGQFETVERHLCSGCLEDITRIGVRYNSDESDSK